MGCFSFHPRKAITTGEGGAVVTDDQDLAVKLRSLRNHGISIVNDKINFEYVGLNYRMTDFQAVLGIAQLNEIGSLIKHRIKMAETYDEDLKSIDWIKTPIRIDDRRSIYQAYHIMVEANIERDDLITALKENGVETNIGAYALHMVNYYKEKYDYAENSFDNAKKAYFKGLVLPIGAHLDLKDYNIGTAIINSISVNK